jgi:hypothetical protein
MGFLAGQPQSAVAPALGAQAAFTQPVVSNGWVSAEGGPDYQQTMGPQMYAAAQELAKVMPPPQVSIQELMAMLGAIETPPELSQWDVMANRLAQQHRPNPPVSGGGSQAHAVGMPAYQQKFGAAGGRPPAPLGQYLRGGGG